MTKQNESKNESKFVYWFKEIGKEDIPLVGGKGANLGEMYNLGIPVPPGFIVSSNAYFSFIEINSLKDRIREILKTTVNPDLPESYTQASEKIKKAIVASPIPEEISLQIMKAYLKLGGVFKDPLVAVRSSATAEDLPSASFAGMQRTFLNVKGEANVLEAVRECWASLFEPRAIFYREQKGFDHFKVSLAIPIQVMVQSVVSGIVFTCDPVNGEKNRIIIDAVYGLGETIVQGEVTPDHYIVDKEGFKILRKDISTQKIMLTRKNEQNLKVAVPKSLQNKQKLSDSEIIKVAKIAQKLHDHYFFPQDCEFALDKKRNIYFVQTRPVTTIQEAKKFTNEEKKAIENIENQIKKKKILLEGLPASPGLAWGPVVIIKSKKEINKVKMGDVLVTSMTTPDFVPAMRKVAAIVTDKGGLTSHAAIVSREMGIPCVVGTQKATKTLKPGRVVTVNGSTGKVFEGGIDHSQNVIEFPKIFVNDQPSKDFLIKTATKLYVNLADWSIAKEVAEKNVDGVGLLRAEFMMADIGVHPKKIIKEKKQKQFIKTLAEKISIFCQEFNPRPVVYRTTDFKTNEYRNLKGGDLYEPAEPNPMLGFRGASRYIANEDVFSLELEAIKMVRNKMGLKNLWLMIPFVRTPDELLEVKKIITSSGLIRSPSFKLWMMVEIPSNVILLEEFLKVGIDGVSIGSNDLTMLILGTDRDNSEVSRIFNEQDPAVLWALEKTITTCRKLGVTSSICGQAPSEYPELVEKLVEWGITSISVNPDAIERTREIIYQAESKLITKSKKD